MSYDLLEQHIHEHDIATYDIIIALHPFYRYALYEKVRKTARLSDDCDIQELALNVIKMLPRLKKSVVDTFELVSLSYAELRQHYGITRQKLSAKADKARINIRKALSISKGDDEVQQKFDADKASRYKSIKYNGFSVQDSINRKKKNNKARDWAISECLESSARLAGLTPSPHDSGYFISLTLPGKYHSMTYEQANDEINRRLNGIKRDAERADILWLGIYKIHGHKDETPHLHIIYFVNNDNKKDLDKLTKIFFKYFQQEEERWEKNYSINQRITYFDGVLGYLFKDHGEANVRTGFIGLRKDIKKVWNRLYTGDYGDSSLSYLSDDRMWIAKQLMSVKEETTYLNKQGLEKYRKGQIINHDTDMYTVSPAYTLFSISGFRDDRLNKLGRNDNELDYIETSTRFISIMEMREYLNPKRIPYEYKKYRKIQHRYYVDLVNGKSYLYINTKNVFCNFIVEKVRGQPPPSERTG